MRRVGVQSVKEKKKRSSRSIVHMDRLLGFACSGLVEAVGFHVRSDELKILLPFFLFLFLALSRSRIQGPDLQR